jgi:hypothetical protein
LPMAPSSGNEGAAGIVQCLSLDVTSAAVARSRSNASLYRFSGDRAVRKRCTGGSAAPCRLAAMPKPDWPRT